MTYVPNSFECYLLNMNVQKSICFVQTYNSKN